MEYFGTSRFYPAQDAFQLPRADAYKLLYARGVQVLEKGIWKIP